MFSVRTGVFLQVRPPDAILVALSILGFRDLRLQAQTPAHVATSLAGTRFCSDALALPAARCRDGVAKRFARTLTAQCCR